MARRRYEDSHKSYSWLITLDITKFKIDLLSFITVMNTMSGSNCIYVSPTTVFVLKENFLTQESCQLLRWLSHFCLPPAEAQASKEESHGGAPRGSHSKLLRANARFSFLCLPPTGGDLEGEGLHPIDIVLNPPYRSPGEPPPLFLKK